MTSLERTHSETPDHETDLRLQLWENTDIDELGIEERYDFQRLLKLMRD